MLIKWVNDLPRTHLLPLDRTLHGMEGLPDVRTVVHVHGAHVTPENDGYPDSWFTKGQSATYRYPNDQLATTLWYHDHAVGITRLNVFAGLAGFYLLRDPLEKMLALPRGKYEIPLLIQDRAFNTDGSLNYPSQGVTHPVWVPEFFGDAALVNGKVWPYLEVEPRKYRFRIVNGSNARFYRLALSSGQPFYQIGTDGGLLMEPARVSSLLMAPAERADVILDFSGRQGQVITMTNDANAPYPDGEDPIIPEIMQFRVTRPLSGKDDSRIPMGRLDQIQGLNVAPYLRDARLALQERQASKLRDLTLEEMMDMALDEPLMGTLNGMMWHDPITEKPKVGETEIWRLVNLTGDTHPIHLHQVQFRILDRQPFDATAYQAYKDAHGGANPPSVDPYLLRGSRPTPPDPNEAGWKDTVRANTGEVIRIIARFDLPGRYVWHCHILEHEDNDMMRPLEVVR